MGMGMDETEPTGDHRAAARSADRKPADDDRELRSSIAGLGTLLAAQLDIEELLTRVASLAVRAVPGAEGAGLTLLEDDRADIIVTTAPFVGEVDSIQYSIKQGPCVSAAAEGRTVLSGSLGGDHRWPQFGSRVARLGVHSALSLPLITGTGVLGALNVYAYPKHVFDERAAELGELFAAPAAVAVQNAQVLAQSQRLTRQLQHALDTRAVVDRAVGIMMSRSGASEQEALARLRTMSQREHEKLLVVAQRIVDEAVRRARSRRAGD